MPQICHISLPSSFSEETGRCSLFSQAAVPHKVSSGWPTSQPWPHPHLFRGGLLHSFPRAS